MEDNSGEEPIIIKVILTSSQRMSALNYDIMT